MKALSFILILASFCCHSLEFESLVNSIQIKPEVPGDNYNRKSHFGDWVDEDDDGQTTRQEVLAEESLIPVTWSGDGKKVISGLWYDPFTGKNFTKPLRHNSSYAILQIDHIVPLKEAWQSGAQEWTKEKRIAFANDLSNKGHLIAVRGGTNGSKGYKDPSEWLPPNENFHCAYVITWANIKAKWGLTMDNNEKDKILEILSSCAFEY